MLIKKYLKTVTDLRFKPWWQNAVSNIFSIYEWINNPHRFKLLGRNKELFMKHKGERCFILGNGPSLNTVDFNLLADETVFTVNWLMLHPDYKKLKSNYHVIMDPAGFGMGDEYSKLGLDAAEYLKRIKSLKTLGNPILFAPLPAFEYLHVNEIDSLLDIRYLSTCPVTISKGYCMTNICKCIPGAINVIHYVILCALYMGFSEIYLLGCNATTLMGVLNDRLSVNYTAYHCYTTEDDKKLNKSQSEQYKLSEFFMWESMHFRGYEYLSDCCKNHNATLVNLTPESLIDSIPKLTLTDILNLDV